MRRTTTRRSMSHGSGKNPFRSRTAENNITDLRQAFALHNIILPPLVYGGIRWEGDSVHWLTGCALSTGRRRRGDEAAARRWALRRIFVWFPSGTPDSAATPSRPKHTYGPPPLPPFMLWTMAAVEVTVLADAAFNAPHRRRWRCVTIGTKKTGAARDIAGQKRDMTGRWWWDTKINANYTDSTYYCTI